MSKRSGQSGILLVDKPQGITSHDVVARVRKAADTRRVGHAGTLDPMATGLLVLGLNSSTRLLTYFVGLDKEYFATIRLGAATNTDDADGEVVFRGEISTSSIADAALEAEIGKLTGEISQVPSSVSAIKVDGKRAYTLVREGETVELKPRAVTISAFEVLSRDGDDLAVRVECSSGTYIRALARDLGAALGTGGHLTALRRTRIGPFHIADAIELDSDSLVGLVEASLLNPVDAASLLFETVTLDDEQARDLAQGKRPHLEAPDGSPVAAVTGDGRLAGLVSITGGVAKPLINFPTDEVLG